MLPAFPTTKEALYVWVFWLTIVYLAAAYGLCFRRHQSFRPVGKRSLRVLFDATAFSFSVMVVIGVVDHGVLELIGDTTLPLIIGSVGGIMYSLHALWPDGEEP